VVNVLTVTCLFVTPLPNCVSQKVRLQFAEYNLYVEVLWFAEFIPLTQIKNLEPIYVIVIIAVVMFFKLKQYDA
jgi:hypothetical protein